jgi:hypothetical protein
MKKLEFNDAFICSDMTVDINFNGVIVSVDVDPSRSMYVRGTTTHGNTVELQNLNLVLTRENIDALSKIIPRVRREFRKIDRETDRR